MATTLLYGGLTAVVCLPCDKKSFFEYGKYEKYNITQEVIPKTESKRGRLYF